RRHRGATAGGSSRRTFGQRWGVLRGGASGLKACGVVARPIGRWLGDFVFQGPRVKKEGN
ncbi:hypothetical protein TorRG33x02_085140, partial [Trema orientale]